MKKIAIGLFLAMIISTPANAGFILGYMVGSMGGNSKISSSSGIPLICVETPDYQSFRKCRYSSAANISWVTTKDYYYCTHGHPEKRDDNEPMCIEDYLSKEWELIQKLKSEYQDNGKCHE